jgi:GNAT superfamily N-acetyltransferase
MALYEFPTQDRLTEVKNIPIRMRETSVDETLDVGTLADGVSIAADAFGVQQISPEFEQDVFEHLKKHHVIIAYAENGEPLGFASVQYLQNQGIGNLYVSGLVIKHHAQKQGVGTALVTESIAAVRNAGYAVDYVSGRTQNPVVAQARMHYCDPVYPITASPNEEVLAIAHSLHSHLGMENPMDPHTLVTSQVYPVPLNRDSRPISKLAQVNDFFNAHVGPRDAAFIIGKPKI